MSKPPDQRIFYATPTWLLPRRGITNALVLLALVLFVFLTWFVFSSASTPVDQSVFDAIAPHITAGRTRLMLFITFLGNHMFLTPANLLLLGFFLVRKQKWMAIRITVISLGGLLLKMALKAIFHRPRPVDPLIEGGVAGFSFPSGHALMSVAFYGFLMWWAAIAIRNKAVQWLIIAAMLFFILIISFSRVYLRVHYITDISAGLCLGICWLLTSLWLIGLKEKESLEKQ